MFLNPQVMKNSNIFPILFYSYSIIYQKYIGLLQKYIYN